MEHILDEIQKCIKDTKVIKIDEWIVADKKAELWIVKDCLQIRHRGCVHNIPLSKINLLK